MKLLTAAACLALGGLLSACGGGSGTTADVAPATPAVARLQWVTPAPLFTANGQQHTLQVQALDASGHVLDVPISWQSNEPNVVAVGGGSTAETAKLTAQASAGAAVLTASAGGHSITAVAVVAVPAVGTVVLTDAQVDGQPQATEATLAAGGLRVGSTYTVRLQAGVAAPAVGSLVLGQGSKAVAGQVVAVDGQLITLAMVPLDRLLPQLQLDLDLPLTAFAPGSTNRSGSAKANRASTRVQAQAETSFSVAGFECDAEGSAGGVELAKKDVAPLGLDSLRYRVLWNSDRKMVRLSGQPGVQFELEPTAKIAFTGKVDCQLELADIPIPLPPAIGLFLGVGFPVGVGFTLEGALPVNGVALNLKGQAQADVVVGFDCNPTCASLNGITPSGSVTPAITAPDFTANRLDLSGQVYAWANFEGGARWSSTLQFDAIEAQAGLKFATTVATENAQAKDAASAGQYALTFEASAAPTEALGDMADLVGLILDAVKLETSVPLGRSPGGTLAADKTSFKAGDDVRFQVDLTADDVLFPLQGYNVQAVRIYRKTVAEDGSYVLVLANEQQASSGQTQFTIPWLATVDSSSNISFVAFVQTRLLSSLRWQVGVVGTKAPVVPTSVWGGNLTLKYAFNVHWTHATTTCESSTARNCSDTGSGSYIGALTHVLSANTAAAVAPGATGASLNLALVSVSGNVDGHVQGASSVTVPHRFKDGTVQDCTISYSGSYSLAGAPKSAVLRRPWTIGLGADGQLSISTASSLSIPSSIDTLVATQLLGAGQTNRSAGCPGGATTTTSGDSSEERVYRLIPSIFRGPVDPNAAVWQGSGVQTFNGTGSQCENISGVTWILQRKGSVTCTATLMASWNLDRQ